jgi:hypothetical protein
MQHSELTSALAAKPTIATSGSSRRQRRVGFAKNQPVCFTAVNFSRQCEAAHTERPRSEAYDSIDGRIRLRGGGRLWRVIRLVQVANFCLRTIREHPRTSLAVAGALVHPRSDGHIAWDARETCAVIILQNPWANLVLARDRASGYQMGMTSESCRHWPLRFDSRTNIGQTTESTIG